jgi:hypothetical protein
LPDIARTSIGSGDIPFDFNVIIYNKGAAIPSERARRRADSVVTLANSGRESDTFLRHILGKTVFGEGYSVFLQGDPFEHSPDMIALLKGWRRWTDLQPLSWQWISAKHLPPPAILARETGTVIENARVRPELFSLSTWGPVQFFDPGAKVMGDWYRDIHDLPEGTNIAADFLRRCELMDLAEQADRHLLGYFAYGALFAVKQNALARLQHKSLELAVEAANAHKVYGYILERLWLHLCGEPFLLSAGDGVSRQADLAGIAPRFVPQPAKQPPHLRIVPAIKRRISHWAQS